MKVYIFTEAGAGFGFGHLTRCSALGEELAERGADITYVISGEQGFANSSVCCVTDWTKTEDFAYLEGNYSIVDSYIASEDLVRKICSKSRRCLCIDDNKIRRYTNCLTVNPASHAADMYYEADASVEFLLGRDYVILRKPFRRKIVKNIRRDVQEITVTIGGTDVLGLVPEILRAMADIDVKINTVVSKNANYTEALIGKNISAYSDLSADEMLNLFINSDLVISAGGQTVNELVQCRTPGIFVCVAENQRNNLSFAVKNGFGVELVPSEIGTRLPAVLRDMNYDARLRTAGCMEKFDYSQGVSNIVNRFLI